MHASNAPKPSTHHTLQALRSHTVLHILHFQHNSSLLSYSPHESTLNQRAVFLRERDPTAPDPHLSELPTPPFAPSKQSSKTDLKYCNELWMFKAFNTSFPTRGSIKFKPKNCFIFDGCSTQLRQSTKHTVLKPSAFGEKSRWAQLLSVRYVECCVGPSSLLNGHCSFWAQLEEVKAELSHEMPHALVPQMN